MFESMPSISVQSNHLWQFFILPTLKNFGGHNVSTLSFWIGRDLSSSSFWIDKDVDSL